METILDEHTTMTGSARVVIVTANHIAGNPRVVKEADALSAAGMRVHVIFPQRTTGDLCRYDEQLLAEKSWRWVAVSVPQREKNLISWGIAAAKQTANQAVPRSFRSFGTIAERGVSRLSPLLIQEALAIPADLYIGHYPEGLAAAGLAAKAHSGMLGFDAEDFHIGEATDPRVKATADAIQRRYLPRCSYVTAASAGIAAAVTDRYQISTPTTIYNTFPWVERSHLDGIARDRVGSSLSLYWYSQTVGMDRGIQDAIRAAALVRGSVQLHIRGTITESVRMGLLSLAAECRVADRVFFHDQVSPAELLSRTAEHDIGLALEQGTSVNRAICTTNKLFYYLLAGLAVAATAVEGQVAVLGQHTEAAALYPPGNYRALADVLDHWLADRTLVERAKAAALECARTRWNWERDSQRLVEVVERVIRDKGRSVVARDAGKVAEAAI